MKKIEGWVTAPQGFIAAGVKAGIKASGNHDVAVIFSTVPAACGAVFTQNKMCAAPVLVSREVNKHGYAQAIAVNSGCANACTGEQGLADAKKMQAHTAELLGIAPEAVFVCSTGVIGQFLPMDNLLTGIADAVDSLDECEGESCAMAIQTTDTFIKHAAYETEIGGKKVTFAGIAKGAGMIHPNMATMLTFITTDAAVAPDVLKRAVKKAADKSFNMVVVDGDTSTNDSMIVLANGLAENEIILSEEHPDYPAFFEALVACATDLAKMIAHDGERFIGYLHVPSLASYENGMGYPSRYRYSMPLYEKYALSNPQGYQAQSKLYGAWILGEPEGNNRVLPSLAGTYERSNKRGTRFVQGETEMPWIVAKLFLQLVLEPNVNLLDRNNGSFSFWDYQWEQEKALYPDVDKRYSYHTMTKAGDPDAPNPVQFKDARYLVEKSGRLIYNVADDGTVRKIYDLANE